MNNFEKQYENLNSRIDQQKKPESSAMARLAIDRALGSVCGTPEQIEESKYSEYFYDRRSDNIDILASRPKLQEIYKHAALRHNHIKQVSLIDDEGLIANAYFSASDKDLANNSKVISSVHFNVLHNFDKKEQQEPGTIQFIKKVALQLGADWKDIYKNRDAFDAFILMHEFGHAADFMSTYYIPIANDTDNLSVILKNAFQKSSNDRADQLKSLIIDRPTIDEMREKKFLPINQDPNNEDPEKQKAIREGVRQRINSYNATQYRLMKKEKKADDFASEMIRQNYDLFFRKQGEDVYDDDLIETGKSIELDLEDWREVVGLHSGCQIRAIRVTKNEEGDVIPKLYDGKQRIIEGLYDPLFVDECNLYINEYNDLSRPKNHLMTNINSVRARRNPNTNNLEYLLTDKSGVMYVMQIN